MLKPKAGSYAIYEPAEEGWQVLEAQFKRVNEALTISWFTHGGHRRARH
jgi:hypothetical protein